METYNEIQKIQDKVFQEIDQYYTENMWKTRVLDDLLYKCEKMTDELTERYINLYIK
jgi:hypothetical protein